MSVIIALALSISLALNVHFIRTTLERQENEQ